jgi:hypothetical protein
MNATQLLNAWELGLSQHPVQRALTLLLLMGDVAWEELAALPIGVRDARLLALRQKLFGGLLACVASCPRCGEKLELSFDASQIQSPPHKPTTTEVAIENEGKAVRFRLPTSTDLLALVGEQNTQVAEQHLLHRCLLDGATTPLPQAVMDEVGARMAQADPQSNVQLALQCPACGHTWSARFDILAFLWAEINDWAQRMVRTVHTLARNYGWREADILAMSAARRQMYLQLLGG